MIQILGIKVGEHSIAVPPGLSELVNQANAWTNEERKKNKNYHREVVFEEGKLTTILTRK